MVKGIKAMSPADRIRLKTEIDPKTGCWIWQGVVTCTGYGRITYQYKPWMAHRLSYEAFVGPIPEGLTLDHLCRTPLCCNPDHLEAVTQTENTRRGRTIGYEHPNAPKTCKRGHSPETHRFRTVVRNGKEVKRCVTCYNEKKRARRARLGRAAAG